MRKILIVIGVLLVLGLAGYIASPFLYISSLKGAFLSADAGKLADMVDFAALRESLKEQITAMLTQESKNAADSNQGPLTALTAFVGPAFLNRAIDLYCTPESIAALVKKGNQIDDGNKKNSSFIKIPTPSDLDWSKLKNFSFTGPTSFRIGTSNITVFARLEGLAWKVYRIEVSPDFLEPSATPGN